MYEVLYFWQYIIKEPYWQFKFILQPIFFFPTDAGQDSL